MGRLKSFVLAALVAALAAPAAGAPARLRPAEDPIDGLVRATGGKMVVHVGRATGFPDVVRATRGGVLASDGGRGSPEARARRFLARHGDVIGMSEDERRAVARAGASPRAGSTLVLRDVVADPSGRRHVRFEQRSRGLPVFGAQVLVHLDRRGVTAVNGHFVPRVAGSPRPKATAAKAHGAALTALAKHTPRGRLQVAATSLQWFRHGLVQGYEGPTVLAYAVEVAGGADGREQVWVDASDARVVLRIPLEPHAKDRVAYTPRYDHGNPDLFAVRREGDPESHVPPVDNLFEFTGQVYDFFSRGFGRDSYDAEGITMRTVYLVNEVCPNAYWNGATTNYCPGFDLDDVVAHEWGHAYTEKTHGLIYMCQSGALNESYSDIWGEVLDLTNDMDGNAGSANDRPAPDGQRWLVSEDLPGIGPFRDMWDPERLGSPGKVTSAVYICANASDNGGVHTNSGIPNHAFAMLVDGKTFNGQTVRAIGMVKATHIYYQAMTAYQHPTIDFAGHEQALLASCQDLIGVNLRSPFTGEASGERLTSDDCAQVAKAGKAVELSTPPPACKITPILRTGAPTPCPGATMLLEDDFESGLGGWTLHSEGATDAWPDLSWVTTANVPEGHPSKAAFAADSDFGSCEAGNHASGRFDMTSKTMTVPAGAENLLLRFTHWISTESFDGGNVTASVNGGDFVPLPADAYLFNAPNATLPTTLPPNPPNPKEGQQAWAGTNEGESSGSWGTTIADLSKVADAGDTIAIRFDFGLDCGGGFVGWYVDDVVVYVCPIFPAVESVALKDLAEETASAPFTISWTRPSAAEGPDDVEESTKSCTPLIADDAESGLAAWVSTVDGVGALDWRTGSTKPGYSSTVFWTRGVEGATEAAANLTFGEPLRLGDGATTLTFKDFFINEGDDSVRVEVSTNAGAAWRTVYSNARAAYAHDQLAAYRTESMTPRIVDLSEFAGKTVLLRFRYQLGTDNRPASTPWGWYLDDIRLESESWTAVATTAATSHRVTAHRKGSFCFRVRTRYPVGGTLVPGRWSAPTATVAIPKAFGTILVKGTKQVARPAKPLPATGVGGGAAGVALAGAATMLGAFFRRRR